MPGSTEHLAFKTDLAWLRFQLGLVRLALLERKYSADQPRVPAGTPEGGRWMGGDDDPAAVPSFLDDRPEPVQVADKTPRPYPIDLVKEESGGGHAIRDHVGKSNAELRRVVESERIEGLFVTAYGLTPEGSFNDLPEATAYVNDVVNSNAAGVMALASGKGSETLTLEKRYSSPTGREAYRIADDSEGTVRIRDTYSVRVILRRVPGGVGFRIVTAFPVNKVN